MLGPPCEISHPLCPMLVPVKLDFSLHNLYQLEGLREGENRRVKTEEGIDTLKVRHEVVVVGQSKSLG